MSPSERDELLRTGSWRQYVIDEARTWKGTPYQHRGRVKGVGVDCGGIIHTVFSPLLPLKPFPKNYPPDWCLHRENEIYLNFIMPYVTPVPKPVPAGIALFKIGRNFGHGAICTEKGTFIHAWGRNQHGSVVESRLSFFTIGNGGKFREVQYFDVSI
jgi:cell wall-associated NlpC family hydrolase